jgi:hypothetical protein
MIAARSLPAGDQVQQLPLPGGQLRRRVAAPFGSQVGLVQVRPQQRAVTLGEIRAAEKVIGKCSQPLARSEGLIGVGSRADV